MIIEFFVVKRGTGQYNSRDREWTDEYQGMIIANILEQLKYENTELIEKLKNCYTTKLFNDCGIEVGHSEVDFKLDIDPTFFEKPEEYVDSDSEFGDTESDEKYDPDLDSAFADEYDPDLDSAFADDDTDTSIHAEPIITDALDDDTDDEQEENDSSFEIDLFGDGNLVDAAPERTPEEEREFRNKKSILGMTVVKPSANKTFISNPRVDPISVNSHTVEAQPDTPESDQKGNSAIPEFIKKEIKSANIISQKKRD